MVIIMEAPVLYENRAIILLSVEKVKAAENCAFILPCMNKSYYFNVPAKSLRYRST